METSPPSRVADWCGTLGTILPLRAREALQEFVMENRVDGIKFSLMLNQHVLPDFNLPNITGAASQKIRKCWHKDYPASVDVHGELPPHLRATPPPPPDRGDGDQGSQAPAPPPPPQRSRREQMSATAPPGYTSGPVYAEEEAHTQADLLRAVLDRVCEKAGVDRQDAYLWVHGVVPNEIWQPMWDGLTVDLLRSRPDRMKQSPRVPARMSPRLSPRGAPPWSAQAGFEAPYGDGQDYYPPGPPVAAWGEAAPGPFDDFDGHCAAASSRRQSGGRRGNGRRRPHADSEDGPPYDYDYDQRPPQEPWTPKGQGRGGGGKVDNDFDSQYGAPDDGPYRRHLDYGHDSPGSPYRDQHLAPPPPPPHGGSQESFEPSERSYAAHSRADRSDVHSVAPSDAMSAWLDMDNEALPCMLPLELADWLRMLPKERVPEDVKKAVAVRVLKDKIDGDRFAELLADGKWDDLDIEDDRAAQVITKFFKNKQREDTMAEAARTTGAINRAFKNKKGEVMVA